MVRIPANVLGDGKDGLVRNEGEDCLFCRLWIIGAVDAFIQLGKGDDADGQIWHAQMLEGLGIGACAAQMAGG